MKEWFEEWFEVHGSWGRHNSYKIYNPLTGELYIHSLLGLVSVILAGANFFTYMQKFDIAIAIFLGFFALALEIVGFILSIKSLPVAAQYKSIFRVGVSLSGIINSLAGILITVATFAFVIIPIETKLLNH